ncbi:MAG: aminotransferase class I/II-fold pyridoxal phosphate-dependent enzyme [Pseudomonadota bacterium]
MPPKDRQNHRMGFDTTAIHLGHDPAETKGALTPPVYMTSTYAFPSTEEGAALFRGEGDGFIYGRTKNPTQALLEERLAALEEAEAGMATASGMGAITTTFWSLLQAGDRVIIDHTLYGSTFAFFTQGLPKFGIETVPVDLSRIDLLEQTLAKGAQAVYFESPANPNLRVLDIAAIAEQAHAAGAMVVVDNTFATPALQRPISLGADLVVHSATKYLGGHGDLLAGLVLGPAETLKKIRTFGLRFMTGATISPWTAFLVLRGLKTLSLRMERHCSTALAIAELLARHPAVDRVTYPGLEKSPDHLLATRQMSGFGGLVAFELKGGLKAGFHFMDALELVTRAVSLGDAETLVQHPASMTHSTYSPEERAQHGIGDGLVRLSAGLENPEDILEDIAQALEQCSKTG